MPAINPAHLRRETYELAQLFESPGKFKSKIHSILDFYADRTRRYRESGKPASLLFSYNVAKPVLRQIIVAIKPNIQNSPEIGVHNATILWDEDNFECKQLAIRILENIPEHFSAQLLKEVRGWVHLSEDDQITAEFFSRGMTTVLKNHPDEFIQYIQDFLNSPQAEQQSIGIWAMRSLVTSDPIANAPLIFKLLSELVLSPTADLRYAILGILESLAQHIPHETAYFLKQNYIVSENKEIGWYIRQSLRLFPADTQKNLRAIIQKQ